MDFSNLVDFEDSFCKKRVQRFRAVLCCINSVLYPSFLHIGFNVANQVSTSIIHKSSTVLLKLLHMQSQQLAINVFLVLFAVF